MLLLCQVIQVWGWNFFVEFPAKFLDFVTSLVLFPEVMFSPLFVRQHDYANTTEWSSMKLGDGRDMG